MKKKNLIRSSGCYVLCIIVLFIVLTFTACTTSTTATTVTATTTQTTTAPPLPGTTVTATTTQTTTAAPPTGKTIELKFSHWSSLEKPIAVDSIAPFKTVTDLTDGRVTFAWFPNQVLGKGPDQYNLVLSRTADIAWVVPPWAPGVFPLTDVMSLPLTISNPLQGNLVFWDLIQKYMLDTEYKEVVVLCPLITNPTQLFVEPREVKTMEDMKGLKIGTESETQIKAVEALGAIPVSMSIPEMYDSLDKGLIDGSWNDWSASTIFKTNEVTKYRTQVNFNTNIGLFLMNRQAWDDLGPENQKAFQQVFMNQDICTYQGNTWISDNVRGLNGLLEADAKAGISAPYVLPPEERDRWSVATSSVADEWAAKMDDKGLPGSEVLADFLTLMEKYK